MTKFNIFLALLMLSLLASKALGNKNDTFEYLRYHEIINKFHNLTSNYPKLMKTENVHDKYGVPRQAGDCGNSKCTIYFVTITDFSVKRKKPQVYLSGNLHGNEQLGPNVLTYLAEYLVTNFDSDPFIKELLTEREILITPMTNAQGYYHDRRVEVTDTGMSVDINRDFPYNREDNHCYESAAARAVYKIFTQNKIYGCLTYHGGTRVIGYPWGSFNHIEKRVFRRDRATHAPDHNMFVKIADLMQKESEVTNWKDLPTGSMTDTVYACHGAMEDWAYANAWDTGKAAQHRKCEPRTYLPYNNSEYFTNFTEIRPSIYLIESSDPKHPKASRFGTRQNLACKDCTSDGHIPRHVRMILAYMDTLQVYPVLTGLSTPDPEHIKITFKVNGCLTLQQVTVLVLDKAKNTYEKFDKLGEEGGHCNWNGTQTEFEHLLPVKAFENNEVSFKIEVLADQDFLEQDKPDPKVDPQTYVVQSRNPHSGHYEETIRSFTLLLQGGRLSLIDSRDEEIKDGF